MSSDDPSMSFPLSQLTTTSTSTTTTGYNSKSGKPFTKDRNNARISEQFSTNNSTSTSKSGTGSGTGVAPSIVLPENSRIVHPQYFEKYTSKKDLIRRLGNLVEVLRHDESIEADNTTEWPGLPGIAQYLARKFVNHTDKDVRLFAVLACMEIFTIYAPEVPWDRDELIDIFQHTVQQLGNLAHTIDAIKQPNFKHYAHILELFAHVKIGCVIVDLAQQEGNVSIEKDVSDKKKAKCGMEEIEEFDSVENPKDARTQRLTMSTTASEQRLAPLEVVIELIHTLLHCVRNEHPVEIMDLVQQAIIACLDEYNPEQGTPIPNGILDELLICIGQGPKVWVVNVAAHQHLSQTGTKLPAKSIAKNSRLEQSSKRSKTSLVETDPQQTKLPFYTQETNPTYVVAASVVRNMLNKLATPVSQLLNGLLNGDSFVVDHSSILCPTSNLYDHGHSTSGNYDTATVPENSVDVYSIVFELHRVAPQILTTVIGTVSAGLQSPDTAKRMSVTNLLGRLFSAATEYETKTSNSEKSASEPDTGNLSRSVVSSNMASEFRPCYREWLGRRVDAEMSIRKIVLVHCIGILRLPSNCADASVRREASDAVRHAIANDPNLDVRLEVIHQITDWVCRCQHSSQVAGIGISPSLLKSVGGRCSSKFKQERRDAVTSLAKIYSHRYMHVQLKSIIDRGDDCSLSVIQEILARTCHQAVDVVKAKSSKINKRQQTTLENHVVDEDSERYSWIPSKVFECLCYTDSVDPEMRNRVIQIIDDVLLGNSGLPLPSEDEKADDNLPKSSKMTPTARAVGLAMIVDSLHGGKGHPECYHTLLTSDKQSISNICTNAYKFMNLFLSQKRKLQQAVSNYIDTRARIRAYGTGTEESLTAEAKATELLESIASLCGSPNTEMPVHEILSTLHSAKDKHIFRILATITDANHTMKARSRALDELPKRTASLGNSVSEWIRHLVKRCAMSDFMNSETTHHCVLLASESFKDNDVPSLSVFLSTIKIAVENFPALGAKDDTFLTLTDLFSDCRLESSNKIKSELQSYGAVTCLSSILSIAATARPENVPGSLKNDNEATELEGHLMKLCTQDGSPEQARNAVYTLARLLAKDGTNEDATITSSQSSTINEKTHPFNPLLMALTSSSKLQVSETGTGPSRLIRTLVALAALSDCAPLVVACSAKGTKAFKFALDIVIFDRDSSEMDESIDQQSTSDDISKDAGESSELLPKTPSSGQWNKRRQSSPGRGTTTTTPDMSKNILENRLLSVHCRRICAAIGFIVSHVRSTILFQSSASKQKLTTAEVPCPTNSDIESIFQVLAQILRDKGLPPSARDRSHCKARHDRAVLRHCASLHLIRLSDHRLGLEKKYISPRMWHLLSESFLDEELSVRSAVMNELSSLLIGTGIYGVEGSKKPPTAPSLRFLALLCLCSDGDHGSDHDMANGGAANVGKLNSSAKSAAMKCIMVLRRMANTTYTQCKALGPEGEKKFEYLKMILMPEYAVPYAFHLLSHRRETPIDGGLVSDGPTNDSQDVSYSLNKVTDESQQRILRKRLKLLFEPLVLSLGDGADNISFLLQMTEMLAKQFHPVDTSPSAMFTQSSGKRWSIDSQGINLVSTPELCKVGSQSSNILVAKLKTICAAGREVLLSFVKKDVNLNIYPGTIQFPAALFIRAEKDPMAILTINEQANIKSQGTSGDILAHKITSPKTVSDTSGNENKRQKVQPETDSRESKNLVEPEVVGEAKRVDSGSSDGSVRKSRVHFSPDIHTGSRQSGIILTEQSKGDSSFGDLSPIPKTKSPQFSALEDTMRRQSFEKSNRVYSAKRTTPQSALKRVSILSKATSEDESLQTNNRSSEIKVGAALDSLSKTIEPVLKSRAAKSDVPEQIELKKGRSRKRPLSASNITSKDKASFPKQINPNRSKEVSPKGAQDKVVLPRTKTRKSENSQTKDHDDLDFEFELSKENRYVSAGRRGTKQSTGSSTSTATSSGKRSRK